MRCQLRLAFDSPCNAYLLTGFDLASLFDLKRLVKSVVMRFVAVAVIYHNAYSPQGIVLYLLDLARAGGFYICSDRCGDVHSVMGLPYAERFALYKLAVAVFPYNFILNRHYTLCCASDKVICRCG